MMSYLLIQHWCSRTIGTLSSARSMVYNKHLDVLVLVTSRVVMHRVVLDVGVLLTVHLLLLPVGSAYTLLWCRASVCITVCADASMDK